ncbi:MAG: hypothetical protein KIT14_03995 [bacterium]|nr:hypothetical protein [bacterium]
MVARRPQSPRDVALAATLHDPTGALSPLVHRTLPWLQTRYAQVAVTTSPPTSPRLVAELEHAGVWAGAPPANLRGPLYRLALRRALVAGTGRVHYLDFDRAIHWVLRGRRELDAVLRAALRRRLLLLGRTPKAHQTHHRPLVATEGIVNRLFADQLGLQGRVDWLVPSFVLDREATALLLRRSRARDAGLYGEWPALLAGLGAPLAYLECRWLDWETPDRFPRAVRRLGLAAWRQRQETPEEWGLRTSMAAEFVRGFSRTLARFPAGDVRLARLAQRV